MWVLTVSDNASVSEYLVSPRGVALPYKFVHNVPLPTGEGLGVGQLKIAFAKRIPFYGWVAAGCPAYPCNSKAGFL